jgi:hypothetical protein
MTTITNANIDANLDVDSPYGPLVRVTDIDAIAYDGNQNQQIEFTTAVSGGPTLWMSYAQLTNDDLRQAIVLQAFNFQVDIETLKTKVDALDTAITAMSLPHTYANKKTIYALVREMAIIAGVHVGS